MPNSDSFSDIGDFIWEYPLAVGSLEFCLQIDASQLDSKLAYIQVTSVAPHVEPEHAAERQTEFEINHDVDTFMFEAPFTKDGRVRANPEDQWKRRTVLYSKFLLLLETFLQIIVHLPGLALRGTFLINATFDLLTVSYIDASF